MTPSEIALRDAIVAQREDDRWDAPYVDEDTPSVGRVIVDGELILQPLVAAVRAVVIAEVRQALNDTSEIVANVGSADGASALRGFSTGMDTWS